jgi:hypothetical protein
MAKNPLNSTQESAAVGYVSSFKQEILSSTTNLRRTWLELYKNYRIFKSRNKQEWQSKLWIPKTFTVIEQIASRTTAHNPKFNLKALQSSSLQLFTTNQSEIDEALAITKEVEGGNQDLTPVNIPAAKTMSSRDILEAYLMYVFTENKLKNKIRLWDKGRLMYGTYHVKIDPKILTEKKVRKKKTDEGMEEIEEEVFKNVIPDIHIIDVFDFLIHPDETNIDEATGVIHKRDKVSINDLDDETYFNLDKIDPSRNGNDTEIPEEIEKKNTTQTDVDDNINPSDFTINEYWGTYSKTGEAKDEKEYIITTVDDKLLIRFEENEVKDKRGNPVRPFVAMHDQPVPGEYYAIGEAESIMSLQEEINHIRNTRVDYNNSVLYPEWLVRKGSGINPFQLVHKPNNIIQADNLQDIQPLQKSVVPQSGYKEEEFLNRDVQDATSTTNFAQPGATSAFTDTATGASIRQSEQNSRMKLKIEYLDDAVGELGRKILIYAAENIEGNIEIPSEDDFINIYRDAFKQIAEGFNPVVISGSMAADTPSERRNEAIARGNISLQYAQAGVPVDLSKEYLNIMSDGFGVKDEESLLGETTGNEQDAQNQLLQQPEQLPQ